jgi:non-lysosomal glucosylceramidase
MSLSWDLPVVQYGGGRKWLRHYTGFFGTEGTHALARWRAPLLSTIRSGARPSTRGKSRSSKTRKSLQWYRGELFNELYYLADGGTIWGHERDGIGNPDHPAAKMGDSFTYMECFDYPFYGSLDVRFYGSFALLRFWPEIEKQEMREYTDTIPESNPQRYMWGWKSARENKHGGIHAQGARSRPARPGIAVQEDPIVNPNQYNYQDVSNWRDLNSKYVLMVWRDYALTGANDEPFCAIAGAP